jgi:hypothetical protein
MESGGGGSPATFGDAMGVLLPPSDLPEGIHKDSIN